MSIYNKIICIVGPTASGKSDIANELAYRICGEVVSADSMQIYKGMDIGTGKIKKNEQKVNHWGLDIVNPDDAYSAALYQGYARKCFDIIKSKEKNIILCGGTGFYIRAAIDDYNFPKGEQINNELREKYKSFEKDNGAHKLWMLLYKKDKKSAEMIHENNVVRVIRALELLEEGKSYFELSNNIKNIKQKYPVLMFGLNVDPQILNERIDKRVDKMLDKGLIDEVRTLLNNGYRQAITSKYAIGYKEIVSYLDGEIGLDEAINKIKTSTHRYAKRQRTWFRADKRLNWIDYNKVNLENAVNEIILYCDKDQ